MLVRRHFLQGLVVAAGALGGCASAQQVPPRENRGRAQGSILTAENLDDILIGSSYLGCGGGGSLSEARDLIAADLANGHVFSLIGVDALLDDDRVACPYALASLAPVSADMQARLDRIENKVEAPTLDAFRLLERHLGRPFSGVIMGEIGPLSLAEGLSCAARLDIPSLDADTVGRATPEINQHSVRVAGHPLTPAAGVPYFGDEVVLQGVQDPSREEDIFRALSVVSQLVGVADAPITGAIAKSENALVKGSVSLARRIGAAVRSAKASGGDAIEAARLAGDGYELFTGRVTGFDWRDEDGFLVGDLALSGMGAFSGRTMRLDYKNEHLVARRDGEVIATCPDLITVIDRDTAEGVNNPDFVEGQSVVVLGMRCDPLWRRPEGLEVFHPRYFGYDVDYRPIEERLS